MDMTPPQAPPALNVPANEAAISAVNRLVTTGDWLATRLASMPSASGEPGNTQRQAYLNAFDAFWHGTARADLAARVRNAMIDLAQLGQDDNTLDEPAAALIRRFTGHQGEHGAPMARMLHVGGLVLAGSLVVHDPGQPGQALLFSSTGGWERFAGLDALHGAVGQRIRSHLARGGYLAGATRKAADTLATYDVTSQPVAGAPLQAYVDHAIAVHRARLDEAWLGWALAEGRAERDTVLADTILGELAALPVLDVGRLLAAREARLFESINEARLSLVPADAAGTWREAADLLTAAEQALADVAPPLHSLSAFAMGELGPRLTALGVSNAPTDITIRVDYSGDITARTRSLQTLFEGAKPVDLSLLDVASQNIAAFDPARLSAVDARGEVIPALDDSAIRRLVREADLATRYPAYLRQHLEAGDAATDRKVAATASMAARMRMHAAEARLSYYLPSEPRSFRFDRTGRGFQWVQAVLDSPVASERRKVEGHDVVVREVTYRGAPVHGVLEIAVRQQAAVPTVLYYTPDAPDGIAFREFDDRGEAARRFLYHPAFREYLLDRLPAEFATITPGRSERTFAGDRLASWVFGQGGSADYTWTAEPFGERLVEGNFLDRVYGAGTQLALRNASAFMRSADDANWAWLTQRAQDMLLDDPRTGLVKGLLGAPAQAARAAWQFYDSVKAGDSTQAWLDFTRLYVAGLGVAAPGVVGGTARSVTTAAFRQGAKVAAGNVSRPRPAIFETRYEAGPVARRGTPDAHGVFTIDGRRYIEHEGRLYGARFDEAFDTWRLQAQGRDAHAWGPAIRRSGAGGWEFHSVGLRGGFDRPPQATTARVGVTTNDWFDRYRHAMERAFPDPFERELVTHTMEAESLGAAPNVQVTLIQRARWIEARANAMSAQGFADWSRQRLGPPRETPMNLTVPRPSVAAQALPPLPPQFRRIDPAQLPEHIYYYGKLPFATSPFFRTLTQNGYNTNWAHLHGERLADGIVGIPFTTIAPTSSIGVLRNAMGNSNLTRSSTFAVRIQPSSLVSNGPSGPSAEIIAIEGSGPTRLVLRPLTGENFLRLGNNQQVIPLGREP